MKKNYAKFLMTAAIAVASVCAAQAEGKVVLEENFDKLEVLTDAGVHKYGKNPWTGKDAEGVEYFPNYTNIQKDGNVEDLNGWSSRTTWMYACQGYIRVSKTSYGGDLISPKFAALTEKSDVKLTWQNFGYTSNETLNADGSHKGGLVHDYQCYYVGVLGAGEIEGADVKQVAFKDADMNDITINAALITIPTDAYITMDTLAAWGFESTKNELTIKNATAETQVVFMSVIPEFGSTKTTDYTKFISEGAPAADPNAPYGVNVKANRIMLDNIKVVTTGTSGIDEINAAKEVKARKVMENGQIYIIAGDKKYNVMGAEVK